MRGLTMVEMLLALALLAFILSAAASWTRMAGRLSAAIEPFRLESAAHNALQMIEDDLVSGDFQQPRPGQIIEPKIRIIDGSLTVRTRSANGAMVIHRFVFDRATSEFSLIEQPLLPPGVDRKRLLLAQVKSVEAGISQSGAELDLTIALDTGIVATRRFHLP